MLGLLSPEILIKAYCSGYFPMAQSRYGPIYWHFPEMRAVFLLSEYKIPRKIIKSIKNNNFQFTIDVNFEFVIEQCSNREDTWISDEIIEAYVELHRLGYAHSVEVWSENEICGGLYGVSIGSAFFGESMFNLVNNASKAAFCFLVNHLKNRNYHFIDSQYINHFTAQLGAIEISSNKYLKLLNNAISKENSFV
ncbi:MAG: leucyl/phenylalanyl-tRNA--protein transferase [Bacteroidota bacterium]